MDDTGQIPGQNPEQTPRPEAPQPEPATPPAQTPPPEYAPGPAPGATSDVKGEFDTSDFVNSFIQTVKDLVTKPAEFFEAMPKNAGYGNVILFGVIGAAIGAVVGNILGLNPVGVVLGVIGGPIAFLVGSFIGGGIIHVTSLIFADGAKGGFEASYRAVAYANGALSLVTSVPFIGPLLGLYGIYLTIVGIHKVHDTSMGKAAVAVLAPIAIFFVLGLILAFMVGAALFSAVGFQGLNNL